MVGEGTADQVMYSRLAQFFDSKVPKVEFSRMNPDLIMTLVETVGGTYEAEGMETNGWQQDYWIPCKYNGEGFTIHGSMYYGTAEITRGTSE